MEELCIVIFRTILILIVLFILTKIMGKKQISQMSPLDYTIGITIGSIAADISLDIDKNLASGLISLIIYALFSVIISKLTLNNLSMRKLFTGLPTILIYNGKLIEKNLKKEDIDINDLESEARDKDIFNLSDIDIALLETNGKITFLTKQKSNDYIINLIIDTKLLDNNLKSIKKDKKWFDKELKKLGYSNYDNILLATIDRKNTIKVYEKNINLDEINSN